MEGIISFLELDDLPHDPGYHCVFSNVDVVGVLRLQCLLV